MTDQEILDLARKCSETNIALGGEATLKETINRGTLLFAHMILSRAIPEGNVVVPKEPTQEMLNACMHEFGVKGAKIYSIMIAAAPAPEGEA